MTVDYLSLGDPLGGAAETGGGANTTLAADTAIGATTITVASATGIADDDFLRIGDTGEIEIRQVATGGVTGTTVTLTEALTIRHDSGDQVREVDDAGTGANLVDLWDDDFSGFAFAPMTTLLPLIENVAGSVGNVVAQDSSKGLRLGTLSFTAQRTADRDTVRGYYEDSAAIAFIDYDGSTCNVQILEFESSYLGVDLWKVTVKLLQLTEPVAP